MSFWRIILEKMLQKLRVGEIKVTFPNKDIKTFKGPKSGPKADVIFITEKAIKDCILGGSLGFCEAIISGEVQSKDISKLIEIGGHEESGLNTTGKGHYFFKTLNYTSCQQ